MLVWRVEHANNDVGPYVNIGYFGSGSLAYQVCLSLRDAHSTCTCHPPPSTDPGIDRPPFYEEICGFDSREKLDKWFHGFRGKLKAAGFVVNKYEVPEDAVVVGERQVIFDSDYAEFVGQEPLTKR